MRKFFVFVVLTAILGACGGSKEEKKETPKEFFQTPEKKKDTQDVDKRYPDEKHFTNVRQLTFGGNNAEAYWNFAGDAFSFQSDFKDWGAGCDQIYYFPLKDHNAIAKPSRVSTGMGRTTCAYFLPGDTEILYASTHLGNKECPASLPPRKDHKYVWPVYADYEIFVADLKGNLKRRLTNSAGYDAEGTVSPQKDKIVFTSTRSGDLELWTMNLDGSGLKQITHELGYDGGAFFSPDGKRLVFRASRPKTKEEQKEYKDFLKQGLVAPTKLEIFTCNADGSDMKQITNLGKANWAPSWHPSGNKIIFASNHAGKRGFNFNLFLINPDGSGLEKITSDPVFDAFAVFSPDGKHLLFSSNRANGGTHDTNLFLADWKEN